MGFVQKHKREAAAAAAAAESASVQARTPSPMASGLVSASSGSSGSGGGGGAKYPRFGKRGAPQAFPSKLYEILEGENPEIVGWTKTGRGFEVRDHARLSSEVLGRFFKQDKFSSFQRQLNLYGFRKITKGNEAGSYQHPHFRRGERTTLLTIRRSTKPSQAPRGAAGVPGSPASASSSSPSPRTASPSDLEARPTPNKPDNSTDNINHHNNSRRVSADARPATPSPPPEPVAVPSVTRGVLPPWPPVRQQQQHNALPCLPVPDASMLRRDRRSASSDDGSSVGSSGGGGVAPSAHNNVLDGGIMMDSGNADRWDHPQHGGAAASTASGSRADSAASSAMWAEAGSGGGGGYPNSNGGQTRCAGAGGGWASADSNNGDRRRWEGEMQHPGSWKVAAVERAAKVARTVDLQREQDVRGSDERGGEVADGGEAVKPAVVDPRDRETSGGLDHQDVEVVGLLQRMAKKSQDSPSRSPLGTEVAQKGPSTSTPLMQSRWEAPAVSNLASRAQPFRMSLSSPQAGSETHEAEQEVGKKRPFDSDIHRERESSVTSTNRRPFGLQGGSSGNEERAGFPHPLHSRLPAPYSALVPDTIGSGGGGAPPFLEPYGSVAHRGGVPAAVVEPAGFGATAADRSLPPLGRSEQHDKLHLHRQQLAAAAAAAAAYSSGGLPRGVGEDRRSVLELDQDGSVNGVERGVGRSSGGSAEDSPAPSLFLHPPSHQRGAMPSSSAAFASYGFDRQFRSHFPHHPTTSAVGISGGCASEAAAAAALHHHNRGAWPGPEGPYAATTGFGKFHDVDRSGEGDGRGVDHVASSMRAGTRQC